MDVKNMNDIEKYRKAGEIAGKAREKSRKWVEEGKTFLEAAERIEKFIREEGGKPAFPVNLSIDNEAAHYTPSKKGERKFAGDQVVKVDIGVHVDGYVGGDTAYTIDFTKENQDLVQASEEALENAMSLVEAGRETNEIGKEIQRTIEERGYKPVRNLTGHGLEKWESHAEPAIPNTDTRHGRELEEGEIIAIEPFASTGQGRIKSGNYTEIYSYSETVQTRNRTSRKLLKEVKEKYHTLPFAKRWVVENFNELKLKMSLNKLADRKALKTYPVLKDDKGSKVSQAEKTVKVEEDGCEVLTD